MATKAEQQAAERETAKAFAQGAAAAAAGQAAGVAAAGATTGAATVSAVEIARAAGRIVEGFVKFLAAYGLLTSDALRRLLTARTRDERFIRQLLDAEADRQVEFDRKAAARLVVALPEALATPDPRTRERRVESLLRQERRYAAARLEAASVRVNAAIEHRDLKEVSPAGAFWQLGAAEQHTAGCLFMAGKFWPWAVLDRVHPPRHAGCTSRLRSLAWAVTNGHMTMGDIPDTATAIRQAAGVVMEAAVADELIGALQEDEHWKLQARDPGGEGGGQWVEGGPVKVRAEELRAGDTILLGGFEDQPMHVKSVNPSGASRIHVVISSDITFSYRRRERVTVRRRDSEDALTEAGETAIQEGNFEKWAEDEIRRAGLMKKDSDYGGMLGRSVMKLVKTFAGEGHSGFSAAMAIAAFEKLARWEPLTPLTSEPSEWNDLGEVGPVGTHPKSKRIWQSQRDPRAFSDDGGKTWKLLEQAVEIAEQVVEQLEADEDVLQEALRGGYVGRTFRQAVWDPLVHPKNAQGRFRETFTAKGVTPTHRPISGAPGRPRLKPQSPEGVQKTRPQDPGEARRQARRESPGGTQRRVAGVGATQTIEQVRREVERARRAGTLQTDPGKRGPMADRLLGKFDDTKDKWSVEVGGKRVYEPARQALHDRIIEKFLADVDKPEGEPQATFTAGGSGSGKSSLIGAPHRGAVRIDPDLLKAELPEYRDLSGARDGFAAGATHEESSDLAKLLRDAATERGLSIEVDGVGDSASGKFVGKLEQARESGYEVNVLVADLPTDVAVERAMLRAQRSGRFIDEDVIRQLHRDVAARFREYMDLDWLHVRVYSNDVPLGEDPVLIADGARGSTLRVVDERKLAILLGKAPRSAGQ